VSLISEGLKKAHMEAMQQDRAQRQAYLRSAGPHVPPRSSSHLAQTIAIALGSAVLASAAVLWIRGSAPNAATPVVVAQPIAVVAQQAPPAHPTPTRTVADAPVASPKPKVQLAPVPETTLPPAKSRTRAVAAADRVVTTREEKAPARDEPAGPRKRDRFTEGLTYASPIQGAGGTELVLSGIVGKSGESLAIINGRTMRPGVMIGPFVIERIEPRRVELRYIDIRFYLTP
jgi:hypothetical protein